MKNPNWFAAILGLMLAVPVAAQTPPDGYPRRPIELVVAYPAGGGMDVTARTLAQEAQRVMGHEFRVQNRTGGAGMVGHSWLAQNVAPDGYTVGVLANPFLALDIAVRGAPFKADQFLPIAGINFTPVLWVVKADGPLGKLDFRQIVEQARQKPGELKIATMPGNVFDFVASIVEKHSGAKFTHVPFQGGRPGVTALLGGNVDIASAFYEEVEQYIKAGQVKAVAVSDSERFASLPDVPAMGEMGVEMGHGIWGASRFITVPPATPQPIRDYLEQGFLKVMRDPAAIEKFRAAGIALEPMDHAATQKAYAASMQAIAEFTAGDKK